MKTHKATTLAILLLAAFGGTITDADAQYNLGHGQQIDPRYMAPMPPPCVIANSRSELPYNIRDRKGLAELSGIIQHLNYSCGTATFAEVHPTVIGKVIYVTCELGQIVLILHPNNSVSVMTLEDFNATHDITMWNYCKDKYGEYVISR